MKKSIQRVLCFLLAFVPMLTLIPTTYSSGEGITGVSNAGDTYVCSEAGEMLRSSAATKLPGDLDNNGIVDDEDVIYLLWHTLMPGDYPVEQNVDFDHNGIVDDEDVIYLLWHTLMPGDYPLTEEKDEPGTTMTYEQYIGLGASEQAAFRKTFDSIDDFFAWYNAAKAEYEAQNPGMDVGSGSVDLEDLMNNNSGGGK